MYGQILGRRCDQPLLRKLTLCFSLLKCLSGLFGLFGQLGSEVPGRQAIFMIIGTSA
ncbi:MAG TPA: hypothetical protein VN444_04570 [Verrucomicrobiae bacterium]|nr:hypothetical protein [Verrucomicrobiae bacterium]